MGQYYTSVISMGNRYYKISSDSFNNGFIGCKLTEHSYLRNEWMDYLANLMYRVPIRLAHIGDYADEYPLYGLSQSDDSIKPLKCDIHWFNYKGKYLINLDKQEYIDFDEYIQAVKARHPNEKDEDIWVMSPHSLLCAVGNGRGGGDYADEYPSSDLVGSWAWDNIVIEDKDAAKVRFNDEWTKLNIIFDETKDCDVEGQE